MPTAKVRRADGHHCFYCNASVGEDAVRCPGCGRSFVSPDADKTQRHQDTKRVGTEVGNRPDRVRLAFRRQHRSYWLMLIVLAASALLLSALFRPRGRARPLLERPAGPEPAYRTIETRDVPGPGVDRLSIVGLVGQDTPQESLRAVLDWMLYSALEEHNRRGKRSVRVVWAYVLDDSLAPRSGWRAMAIWTDPRLPDALRPAGIGGDAVEEKPVEYDFTNPVGGMGSGG